MPWEKPAFREIGMSSEIGGYQEDFDQRAPADPTGAGLLGKQSEESADLSNSAVHQPPCG